MTSVAADHILRRAVWLVAVLNLAYFGIEFAVARAIGSVSLFADSIDFLEDASINFLILVALGWTARTRALVGMALAGILFMPGLATLWTAWEKFNLPVAPDPALLSLTGVGALAVNMSCALSFSGLPYKPTISVWVNTSILPVALMLSMRYCDMLSARLRPRTSIQIFAAKLHRKTAAWPAELPPPTRTISSLRHSKGWNVLSRRGPGGALCDWASAPSDQAARRSRQGRRISADEGGNYCGRVSAYTEDGAAKNSSLAASGLRSDGRATGWAVMEFGADLALAVPSA